MNILFKTNLDNYKTNCFPNISVVPRIGESVQVTTVFLAYFQNKKLPTSLKVVDVIYTENTVICELTYKQIDIDIAKQNNVNLFR